MEEYSVPVETLENQETPKKSPKRLIILLSSLFLLFLLIFSSLYLTKNLFLKEETQETQELKGNQSDSSLNEGNLTIKETTERLLQKYPHIIEEDVINCGVSTRISNLPIIYGDKPKLEDVYPQEILELYEEDCRETGDCGGWCGEKGCSSWEEAEEIMVLFYTPSVLDYSSDEAVLCMGDALINCDKAIITIWGTLPDSLEDGSIQTIESKGRDVEGNCVIELKLRMEERWSSIGQDYVCTFEGDHLITDHSCGTPVPISGECDWKGEPGAVFEGLLEVKGIEALAEISGEETYSGEPHCEFLGWIDV